MGKKKNLRNQKWTCEFCKIFCTSAPALLDHVTGRKHRVTFLRVRPECLHSINKLQFIFDTYLRPEPLVGLEYIEERKEGINYRYKCLLCGYQGQMQQIFVHITGPEHITKYLGEDHPDLIVSPSLNKSQFLREIQEAAAKVCKVFGRKKIIEVNGDGSRGPSPKKVSESSSDPKIKSKVTPDTSRDSRTRSLQHPEQKGNVTPDTNRDSRTRSLQYPEQKGNVNPNNNRDSRTRSSQHPEKKGNVTPDTNRDSRTRSLQQKGSDHPAEVSEFTGNREFLDFLQKFKIRSEDDAWVIEQIIQNCTQALVRFGEEEAEQNRVLGGPTNEAGKDSSVSAMDTGKVAPALELQTNAAELSVNGILNMEESEVGGILNEIEKMLILIRPSVGST